VGSSPQTQRRCTGVHRQPVSLFFFVFPRARARRGIVALDVARVHRRALRASSPPLVGWEEGCGLSPTLPYLLCDLTARVGAQRGTVATLCLSFLFSEGSEAGRRVLGKAKVHRRALEALSPPSAGRGAPLVQSYQGEEEGEGLASPSSLLLCVWNLTATW